MDIQNLAAEMGLGCIVTYKLDALKAVRRENVSNAVNVLDGLVDNVSDSSSICVEKISCSDVNGVSANKTCEENGRYTLCVTVFNLFINRMTKYVPMVSLYFMVCDMKCLCYRFC